jgi:hypothetical protein
VPGLYRWKSFSGRTLCGERMMERAYTDIFPLIKGLSLKLVRIFSHLWIQNILNSNKQYETINWSPNAVSFV